MTDTRHLVIDGRRWRRSDPAIPAPLNRELVHALMKARRAVSAAKRLEDAQAERVARRAVNDAKVALGERGPAWWEPPTDAGVRARARAAARALLGQRGGGKTICPSDVARVVAGTVWRKWMSSVRDELLSLAERGELQARQKGRVVDGRAARGPLRFALPRAASSTSTCP